MHIEILIILKIILVETPPKVVFCSFIIIMVIITIPLKGRFANLHCYVQLVCQILYVLGLFSVPQPPVFCLFNKEIIN